MTTESDLNSFLVNANGIDYPFAWTITKLIDSDIEPVTVAEAKAHMRVEISDDDTYIGLLITAAREWCEDYTGRALIDQTWQLRYEGYFFKEFRLHRSPVISVHSFIYDVDGVATTLDSTNYVLDGPRTKWPRLLLSTTGAWPTTNYLKPVTIQFSAGYANRQVSPTEGADKVPMAFKHAIKMIVAHFYENRENVAGGSLAEIPMGARFLLDQQRCETGLA